MKGKAEKGREEERKSDISSESEQCGEFKSIDCDNNSIRRKEGERRREGEMDIRTLIRSDEKRGRSERK